MEASGFVPSLLDASLVVLDRAQTPVVGLDEHGRVVYANPFLVELGADLPSRRLGQPPDTLRMRDGRDRRVRWLTVPLRDRLGEVAVLLVGEDVTDRPDPLTPLREATEVFRGALAAPDPGEVMRAALEQARRLVTADTACVVVPDGPGDLRVEAAAGLDAHVLEGRQFPRPGSVSGLVLDNGTGVAIDELSIERRSRRPVPWCHPFGPALFVPLPDPGATPGVLVAARRRHGGTFSGAEHDTLAAVADPVAVAVRFGRAQAERGRDEILREQERIAREVHEPLLERLFAVSLTLEAAATARSGGQRERIERAVADLDTIISDTRSALFAAAPPAPPRPLGKAPGPPARIAARRVSRVHPRRPA